MNISKRNYGEYSSDNYGSHTQQVDIGNVRLFFSYDTVVAFNDNGRNIVCENVWGTTTGKHLNWIDGGDKKARLSSEKFNHLLNEMLKSHNLIVG
uniref:DUF8033 domain-containing protein n=1 Tax=viral metagenome TaxID=1070528 RepID=A0A6M3LNP1_9ZZZZ